MHSPCCGSNMAHYRRYATSRAAASLRAPVASPRRSEERVSKVLARAVGCSRRAAEKVRLGQGWARSGRALCSLRRACAWQLVLAKRVSVNGTVLTSPALNVDAGQDQISLDGRPINPQRQSKPKPEMYVVHKLPRELVTRHDPMGRPTIFDRMKTMGLPNNLIAVVSLPCCRR